MQNEQAKLRIGILMGGKSIEREVSFNSGRTVCDHLDTNRYSVIPIFQQQSGKLYILPQRFLHRGKISDFEHRLAAEAQEVVWDILPQLIDFAYIAMHGRYAEDGAMQGMLEILGIPYLGSKIFSSALGMHKIMQKDFLRKAGVNVARDCVISCSEILEMLAGKLSQEIIAQKVSHLNFPLIVKPGNEGSSFGVFCVRTNAELYEKILQAAQIMPHKIQPVLIEEKIVGMEFTTIVISDYHTGELVVLPPTEVIPESDIYEYDQKYMPGRAKKITPARCTSEQQTLIQEAAKKVMRALGFTTIGRIDGFLVNDMVYIIDPNSFCGMAPSSFAFVQAAQHNMSHTQFINHLIETELYQSARLQDYRTINREDHSMAENKIRVAVLFGGTSAEKEISLESGRNIVYKLSPHKYEAIPLFIDSSFKLHKLNQKLLVYNATHEIEAALNEAQPLLWSDLPAVADFVFIGLHGGKGENGSVQGALEMLGLAYNGSSVLASALCMDKFKTTQFLSGRGFSVPQGRIVTKVAWQTNSITFDTVFEQPGKFSAYIVKPHNDGCSTLVFKVRNDHELQQALAEIFATERDCALVEECIVGTELTVGVIGNNKAQALPPSEAIARGGILSIEEKFLPGAGENQTPALLPQETLLFVQKTMEEVYEAVGCKGYARIDCFYQNAQQSPTGSERVVIIEINTLPGMTPATCIFHQAAELGMKPMDFVDTIITLGFEEHGQRKVDAAQQPVHSETTLHTKGQSQEQSTNMP
jgi:UDP-N-acetylmuramate--alanine ligase